MTDNDLIAEEVLTRMARIGWEQTAVADYVKRGGKTASTIESVDAVLAEYEATRAKRSQS